MPSFNGIEKCGRLSMWATACVFVGLMCLKETAATGGVHLYVGTGAPGDCETIHCAQQKVRDTLAAHQRNGPASGIGDITVHITGGSYELDRPLVFDERDHANGTVTIIWQGPSATNRHEAGFKPARILCGKALQDWEVAWGSAGSRVYKTFLGRRVWSISENGRQSNPARHPNTNPGSGSGQLNATSYSNAGITWSEGALPANVSKFGLGNTTVLMASGLNYYWTETWKVGNYSLENRTLEFTDTEPEFPGDHSGRTVKPGPHFYIQGSVGLLDEPGEFACDADGWLYYWPRSGRPIRSLEIVAPISRDPIQITGPAYDRPVQGLTFRGLEFVGSDQDPEGVWYLFNPSRGNATPKRFRHGLIFTENATNILIEHCKILAAGNAGVWLNLASSYITLRGNWIEDTAYCGVFAYGFFIGAPESYLKGPSTTAADTYVNHHHVIDSNVIHNVGRMNAGAAGVWLHASGENNVTRNYINRSPRNGVGAFGIHFDQFVQENPQGVYEFKGEDSMTFETQFEICHTRNNTIAYNEMSNVVRDSCDPGAIESYGVGKGHNVSYNSVHDITQPPVLFNRESDRKVQVISLLFSDAQTHYAEYKGNLIFESNACTGDGAMIKNWETNFENNIVADSSMPNGAWIGSYSGPVGGMQFHHNVYWNTTGYCGKGWPVPADVVAPPSSPTGLGAAFRSSNYQLDNGRLTAPAEIKSGIGWGGVLANATGTCYHTMTGSGQNLSIGCNHYPNCNWAGHISNYHLTLKQLERPVVSFIDYDLHEEPVNANVTKALRRLNKTWMQHSVQATGDPFARINPPWLTNTSDFAATSAEARKVLHEPLPLHDIGLGGLFDEFFDRSEVGRRDLFRDGDPNTAAAAPRFHFEDNDRVRGLTVSASLGLIAIDEFLMGEGGAWAVFRNVNFNTNSDSMHDEDGLRMIDVGVDVAVTVRAQTNADGACGDAIDASAPTTGPENLPRQPPPPVKPLQLSFSTGAPLAGGSAATVLGSMTLESGREVTAGAQSGQKLPLKWCDYEATITVPATLVGANADLYVSMRGNSTYSRFTLDFFSWSTK